MKLSLLIFCISSTLSLLLPSQSLAFGKKSPPKGTVSVQASTETQPVSSKGDAADDVAIWLHPTDPSQSLIIGTDKQSGLGVYNLAGKLLHFYDDGNMNNVDIRYGFDLNGQLLDVVVASNRSNKSLYIYTVDPETRGLTQNFTLPIPTPMTPYGFCMYKSAATGKIFGITIGKEGQVEQYELLARDGKIGGQRVRSFKMDSVGEGCVADDELGHLYLGQEDVGVWKFSAEPHSGSEKRLVDKIGSKLAADIEGITLYLAQSGRGYLIVSSQGSNSYAVYDRAGDNPYLMSFQIKKSVASDGAEDTDGIDVLSSALGPQFPNGIFIAQDGKNTQPQAGKQNFKLVPWERIAEAKAESPLLIEPDFDPRR